MRKIVATVLIGLLLAAEGTHITYTCAPVDSYGPTAGCVSYDKAVMHPSDLLNNKQDSLVHFSETLAITSLVSFALLSTFTRAQKLRQKRPSLQTTKKRVT